MAGKVTKHITFFICFICCGGMGWIICLFVYL